ncbi:hypothetical protein [Archangium sp.]|jgi:hypothetical protein|uniref:hypothetical protein n=1 Tax=Archangium sp. TaxID=1872627 RepID=UPI002ED85F44
MLRVVGGERSELANVSAGAEALFALGTFSGQAELAGRRLTSTGGQDVFLARLDEEGHVSWLQHFGGPSDELSDGLAPDTDGTVVAVGSFAGTGDFVGMTLQSTGELDCFVMKRAQEEGRLVWARRFGGSGRMMCRAVALDSSGDIIVTGVFYGTVDLGPDVWRSAGEGDTFLMKLSGRDGSLRWARQFGGTGDDVGRGLAVDASGTIYFSGHFSSGVTGEAGTVDFGGGALTSAGDADAFLTAFSWNGRCLWARAFGRANFDMAKSVVVGLDGNLYLTGLFQRDEVVRPEHGILFTAGGFEGYLASYSATGEERWVRRFPTMNSGHKLAVGPSGELVLTGHFTDTLDLGAAGTLRSEGKRDVFVAGFGPEGKARWAHRFGGPGQDYGYAVAVTRQGAVILGGLLEGTPQVRGHSAPAEAFLTRPR